MNHLSAFEQMKIEIFFTQLKERKASEIQRFRTNFIQKVHFELLVQGKLYHYNHHCEGFESDARTGDGYNSILDRHECILNYIQPILIRLNAGTGESIFIDTHRHQCQGIRSMPEFTAGDFSKKIAPEQQHRYTVHYGIWPIQVKESDALRLFISQSRGEQ